MMSSSLSAELSKRTSFFGLKLWVIIGVTVGAFIVVILFVMSLCLGSWRKSRKYLDKLPVTQIPAVSKEIKEVKVDAKGSFDNQKWSNFKAFVFEGSKKYETNPGKGKGSSQSESEIGVNGSSGNTPSVSLYNSSYAFDGGSPLCGMPQVSSLGWGYWFTLRDLEIATNYFTKENVVGEGGYGIVYRGILSNGSVVAVKNLFNNLGQAEKEFKVEVEAIGRVRHKNLVRLLGYCVEGTHRILVYEYVDNGNLEQWLHEPMNRAGVLSWEARMRIVFGTAKALAYLHEALEPKVVHRDIKSSNILIDHDFNAKVSDFGLAKLLGSGKSHVTTRVMGTFGYVAPEYANTGLLNERSDVYSFGVLLLEAITGREPIDYRRPPGEVNLVDWLKTMVGSRRCEDVLDPSLETKPPTRELKKALLVALRCVDPDSERRPKMGQVVHMHEADGIQTFMPKNRRSKSSRTTVTETVNKERPMRKLTRQSKGSSIGCSRSQK